MNHLDSAIKKVNFIRESFYTIYDEVPIGDNKYWLTAPELEEIFNSKLEGMDLNGLKLRTRSKVVKSAICEALGYPIPKSFKKTKPRFIGQKFDTYTQKSNNLQVWNDDLDSNRRYVLIRINENDKITKVKVVSGSDLATLDTTGTLTQKYQAKLYDVEDKYELVSEEDTEYVTRLHNENDTVNLKNHELNKLYGLKKESQQRTMCLSNNKFSTILKHIIINQRSVLSDSYVA